MCTRPWCLLGDELTPSPDTHRTAQGPSVSSLCVCLSLKVIKTHRRMCLWLYLSISLSMVLSEPPLSALLWLPLWDNGCSSVLWACFCINKRLTNILWRLKFMISRFHTAINDVFGLIFLKHDAQPCSLNNKEKPYFRPHSHLIQTSSWNRADTQRKGPTQVIVAITAFSVGIGVPKNNLEIVSYIMFYSSIYLYQNILHFIYLTMINKAFFC